MNVQTNDRCACVNCPKNGCACGCQSMISASAVTYAGMQCQCARACRCEGAEQGCLCRR